MSKVEVQLISSKAMLEYIETINYEALLTRNRELYNGRNLIAKQIKAKI